MIRPGVAKFPNSAHLFRFCHKVLTEQKGAKIHDQEVGSVLNFNPSDCSHWKRGEKNVRSVFALAKLAEQLNLEVSLVHDIAAGSIGLEEAYFEYIEAKNYRASVASIVNGDFQTIEMIRTRIESLVADLHKKIDFLTPPLYLPEVFRFFSFITTQPIDMLEKLSRILRVKPGQYVIQVKKGELKPQTRMSICKDLARIVFEAERGRFANLGPMDPAFIEFEKLLFCASLLVPKALLAEEMAKLNYRQNVVAELATLFWVPKSLISFQLQDILRGGKKPLKAKPRLQTSSSFIEEALGQNA